MNKPNVFLQATLWVPLRLHNVLLFFFSTQKRLRTLQWSAKFSGDKYTPSQWFFIVSSVVWGRCSACDATSGFLQCALAPNSTTQYQHYAVQLRWDFCVRTMAFCSFFLHCSSNGQWNMGMHYANAYSCFVSNRCAISKLRQRYLTTVKTCYSIQQLKRKCLWVRMIAYRHSSIITDNTSDVQQYSMCRNVYINMNKRGQNKYFCSRSQGRLPFYLLYRSAVRHRPQHNCVGDRSNMQRVYSLILCTDARGYGCQPGGLSSRLRMDTALVAC